VTPRKGWALPSQVEPFFISPVLFSQGGFFLCQNKMLRWPLKVLRPTACTRHLELFIVEHLSEHLYRIVVSKKTDQGGLVEKLYAKEDKMGAEFSASDALLTQAMSGGIGGGIGGGRGGWGPGGVEGWAGNAPIRADILANRDIGNTGIENLQREFSSSNTRGLVSSGHEKICDNINNSTNRLSDNQFRAELRASDQHAATTAQLVAMAAAQALCCCEAKLQAAENQAATMAKMEALAKENVAYQRDTAERELTAIKYSHHGHHIPA